MENNYGFVKLCYGVVGSYKDTSNMTTDEVIEEFLKHEGVSSAEEYFDKTKNNTYGRLNQEVLTKQTKYDKIEHNTGVDLDVDELTPCLRRLKDNEIVDTEVFEIKPTKKEFSNWEFDWTLPAKQGYAVYAIKAKGDERIQGLVAMKSDRNNYAYEVLLAEAAPFNNPHHKTFVKKEYNGIGGHLFAEAVKRSMQDGFGGAVYFVSKTNLIEHYKKELGAHILDDRNRRMFIDEKAAKKLYERYFGGKET